MKEISNHLGTVPGVLIGHFVQSLLDAKLAEVRSENERLKKERDYHRATSLEKDKWLETSKEWKARLALSTPETKP